MRWIKLIAILSLWLFFFGVLDRRPLVDHRAKASEPLEDCQPLDTRLYVANEADSEYQNNGGGRRGAA